MFLNFKTDDEKMFKVKPSKKLKSAVYKQVKGTGQWITHPESTSRLLRLASLKHMITQSYEQPMQKFVHALHFCRTEWRNGAKILQAVGQLYFPLQRAQTDDKCLGLQKSGRTLTINIINSTLK